MPAMETIRKTGLAIVRTPFVRMLVGASVGWYATNLAEKTYDKYVMTDHEVTTEQPTE